MKASVKGQKVTHPLKPIFNKDSEVLILGSFPSVVSRNRNMYYANPTNRFWKVMEMMFSVQIENREQFCLQQHLALWDVIHSCTIHGSSDSSIQDVVVNDIASIVKNTKIKAIFTTGTKATNLYEKYIHLDIPHYALPSTSSANAKMHIEELVLHYQKIKEIL